MDLTLQRTLDICRASETASQIKVLVSSERTEVHLIKNKYQGIQAEYFTKGNIAFFFLNKQNKHNKIKRVILHMQSGRNHI